MKIEIAHIDACPSWREAGQVVTEALDELGIEDVLVGYARISTAEQAAAIPFAGSPTILVDGADLFPDASRTTDLACRVYQVDGRLAPYPSLAQVRERLAERLAG